LPRKKHGVVVPHDQELACTKSRLIGTALLRVALAIGLVIILLLPAPLLAEDSTYRLAPGDRITVTVFGQPELTGDLVIDGTGTIAVPLAGPIAVGNLTVLECERRIAERLADGILRKPSVSVRIAELRPLYVLGDVRLPGAYPFRYGATVLSAVALAGGFGPSELLRNAAVPDYLLAEERVRTLLRQQRTLLVRKARLEAQRDGRETFSPPDAGAADDKEMAEIVANENDLFVAQAAILQSQIVALRSQMPLLKQQIDANNEQGNAGKKQLDLIRNQIERYGGLVRQGLGTQNNDFQYRVLEANQEAAVWRLLSDVSRLQAQTGDLEYRIREVEASFKRQVATELQQTRDRLSEVDVALPAAIKVRDIKLRYAGSSAQDSHSISITRMRNGHAEVLDAEDTTTVEPGDVIDVRNDISRAATRDEAAARLLSR
jgi:polysaccharide export outer membrane protein